ncbi:MAG TPA: UPF0182 family protein [Vicinamibacterales bacterium]|jgi:uncharacterized membrane protein (UPF0182 family)|nr:UPF0182 family protein [Vicinamibacterales bacterium]
MLRRHPLFVVLVTIALFVFFVGPSILSVYTDWLWFGELGYQQVYSTTLAAQGVLFTIVFAITALWLWVNLRTALASLGDSRPMLMTRDGVEIALPGRRQLQTIASGLSVIVALLAGLIATSQWQTWLTWLHAVPFGQVDPLLGHDASFYVFTLPFLEFVHGTAETLVILAGLACGAIYVMAGSLAAGFPTRLSLPRPVRRHLSLLAAALFAVLALGAWIERAEYLTQAGNLIHGATYADAHARIPATLALTVVAALGVVLAAYHATARRSWPLVTAGVLYVVIAVGGNVYGSLLQRFVVTPNEEVQETPFIEHNIAGTRQGFGLQKVEERALSGDAELTRDDIVRNRATLDNVRLWDQGPLRDTFGQLQEIRTYYDFVTVDNDRYMINGMLRQVMLSARELNWGALPNKTWVNDHLTFTHGYGLTLGPVNQVSNEGLPVLYIRNMPPETEAGLKVDQPSIYFGELSNDYIIVGNKTAEFDYPSGDDNVSTHYSGRAGVPLDSLWKKFAFAMRFRDYQILVSEAIGSQARILFTRNIVSRVTTLAPFLTFDRDPYLVLADGRLYWMIDAYTTSGGYPYSTAAGDTNYIRNSVKFVVDAYQGTTTAYLADPTDPIALTYQKIFPDLFKPLSAMPATLRAHIRYPEDLFRIQATMYARYHMTEPAVFYNREDQWQIPSVDDSEQGTPMLPYYTVMRLPGQTDEEFIQMLPFSPQRRDNLAAWLVARSDPEHYGQLEVFQFPKQKLVYGPRQVVARINQDQTISPVITLWNQQGSQVLWGTLMVIPIEESLIYVRPLYLRGSGGQIPELRRVVVAYQNQIVMEPTLDAGLARLFGGAGPAPPAAQPQSATPSTSNAPQAAPAGPPANVTALAGEARTHYDRAIEAQRAGDWAKYGEEIKALGEALRKMAR